MQNLMQSKTQEHAILSNEIHRIQLLFSKTTQRDDLWSNRFWLVAV